MSESYVAGPWECALPGCFDRERHWHPPRDLHEIIASLTSRLAKAEAVVKAVQRLMDWEDNDVCDNPHHIRDGIRKALSNYAAPAGDKTK